MSILFALALAAAPAAAPVRDITERAKAFVGAILAPPGDAPPPYASAKIEYVVDIYGEPKDHNSLAWFRKTLQGCSTDLVVFQGQNAGRPDAVYVSFLCPTDAANPGRVVFMLLTIGKGDFVKASLHARPDLPVMTSS